MTDLDSFDSGSEMTEAEVYERRGYEEDFSDEDTQDPAMRNVTVTEAYMRIDADGTGVPVLHKITLGGTAYEMLDYEPCDEIPLPSLKSIQSLTPSTVVSWPRSSSTTKTPPHLSCVASWTTWP